MLLRFLFVRRENGNWWERRKQKKSLGTSCSLPGGNVPDKNHFIFIAARRMIFKQGASLSPLLGNVSDKRHFILTVEHLQCPIQEEKRPEQNEIPHKKGKNGKVWTPYLSFEEFVPLGCQIVFDPLVGSLQSDPPEKSFRKMIMKSDIYVDSTWLEGRIEQHKGLLLSPRPPFKEKIKNKERNQIIKK